MRKTKTRAAIALLALTAIAAPAGAVMSPLAQAGPGGGDAAHGASSHVVVLKGMRYHPSTISIRRGESVTWVWRDGGTEHNVTGHGFHSRTQARGSFTVRFTRAGTFSYHCTIHVSEGMVGKVIVH
ncbi:MAG: plastocyanin/azurin family copper-binding protein [Solirubrobacterales bacterium]